MTRLTSLARRSRFVVSSLALLGLGWVALACSGSVYTSKGCEYDGEMHEVGDSFPDADGCNDCTCQEDGTVACTLIACNWGGDGDGDVGPGTCERDGIAYEDGAAVPNDGCNSCYCEGGEIFCTLSDCEPVDELCSLPFEIGDCDAAIPVFWHNPETGECEEQTYGGCGGNDNRFASLSECQEACSGSSPGGVSCVVDGVTYPDGATDVPDPGSCNSCSCDNGEVTGCTEIGCPTECPEGHTLATECAVCGPADGCEAVFSGCLPVCEVQEDCMFGLCLDGVCKNVCG